MPRRPEPEPARHAARALAALALVAAVVVALTAPVTVRGAGRAGTVPAGRAPGLSILFTGDVVGFIEPCG